MRSITFWNDTTRNWQRPKVSLNSKAYFILAPSLSQTSFRLANSQRRLVDLGKVEVRPTRVMRRLASASRSSRGEGSATSLSSSPYQNNSPTTKREQPSSLASYFQRSASSKLCSLWARPKNCRRSRQEARYRRCWERSESSDVWAEVDFDYD